MGLARLRRLMFMNQALKMDTGFGALLGIDHAAVGEGIATELLPDGHAHPRFVATCNDGKGLLLHYPILPGLCTTPSSRYSASATTADSPSMPRAVLLAVFDHASTYSMAVADKWARPGVSINLAMEFSPEAHRIMVPGAVLAMECNSTKIGRVAGFAECKVTEVGTGALVARGRHVKHMPMPPGNGKVWETLMSPAVMPHTEKFVHMVGKGLRNKTIASMLATKYPSSGGGGGGGGGGKGGSDSVTSAAAAAASEGSGAEDLPLVSRTNLGNLVQLNDDDMASPDEADTDADANATFATVSPTHNNPLGMLHGGCQAVLSELLGRQSAEHATGTQQTLRSIQVSFLRPGFGDITLKSVSDFAGAGAISTSVDLSNKRGLISQARLAWQPLAVGDEKKPQRRKKQR